MAKRKHALSSFSLAFLDVMSCGFGAAVLIFMIIKHNTEVQAIETESSGADYEAVQQDIIEQEQQLAQLSQLLAQANAGIEQAQAQKTELAQTLTMLGNSPATADADELDSLKKQLKRRHAALLKEREKGAQVKKIKGAGKRQYVTGLKVEGRRILILFDRSASMLDTHLINILRGKHLVDSEKRKSEKWRWSLRIFDWLIAHLPPDSRYQVMGFSDKAVPALKDKGGTWLAVKDKSLLRQVSQSVHKWVPDGGTNLREAFISIRNLSVKPDAVYLVTDGLPTRASTFFEGKKASAEQRLKYFKKAVSELPGNIPVNVVLLPIEGDPLAAEAFWFLAYKTRGRFLAPPQDWP